jgi:hypothetical protein
MYVGSRLRDRSRKIRNYTLFFRPDGILPADELTREEIEPILIKEITQLTKQSISIEERKERSRQ